MAGINRAYSNAIITESRRNLGLNCVFLSHQKADSSTCKMIAAYLMNAGIDVYFDEFDSDLKFNRQSENPKGVVACIRKGIEKSSHMLVLI